MWRHPVTAKQLRVLTDEWGYKEPSAANGGAQDASSRTNGWFQVIQPISK
jgi:phosphopantothenoylcysteine decarboxylase